jgi:hypothetical protein
MDDNPYRSPEHVEVETKSAGPKRPTLLDAVLVGTGASMMLFLTGAVGLMLLADWLGVTEWFRAPIDTTDPERGWAFWYAFPALAAVSILFGVVAGKRHFQKTEAVVDAIVALGLVVVMCVLVVVAYLTTGFK